MNEHKCEPMKDARSRFLHYAEGGYDVEMFVGYDEFGDAYVAETVKDKHGNEVQRDAIGIFYCPYCGEKM